MYVQPIVVQFPHLSVWLPMFRDVLGMHAKQTKKPMLFAQTRIGEATTLPVSVIRWMTSSSRYMTHEAIEIYNLALVCACTVL